MTLRIITLIASATEIVCALGFGESMVGRSHECDYPPSILHLPVCTSPKFSPDGTSYEIDQRVKAILQEGVSVYRVDATKLESLKPTHLITQDQCEVCAVSLQDVQAAACDLISSRPEIVSLKPDSLADIWDDIRRIGGSLDAREANSATATDSPGLSDERSADDAKLRSGASYPNRLLPADVVHESVATKRDTMSATGKANELIERLQGRLSELRQIVAGKPKPTVACIEWIEPLMAAGNWMPELIDIAGGINLFGEAGKHSPWMQWEELQNADPDFILISPCGFDIARTQQEVPLLEKLPGYQNLKAVRNKQVFVIDGNQYFNRPGPRVVESAEILVEVLHPGTIPERHRSKGWLPV